MHSQEIYADKKAIQVCCANLQCVGVLSGRIVRFYFFFPESKKNKKEVILTLVPMTRSETGI